MSINRTEANALADSAQSTIETTNLDRCYELITIAATNAAYHVIILADNNPDLGTGMAYVDTFAYGMLVNAG